MVVSKAKVVRKVKKIILRSILSAIAIIFVCLLLLTIPSVQTFMGKQVTKILSNKMQAKISIEKLTINFDGKIVGKGICIFDQKGNNLISAKYAKLNIPIFRSRYIEFNNVFVDSADVYFRTYQGENELNLKFFVDFFKTNKEKKTKMVVNFQKLVLKNSRFHLRNDNTALEDEEGVWNYRNMIISNINTKMQQMLIVGDSLNFYIDELTCKERSGFELTSFKGHLRLWSAGLYCYSTDFITANNSLISTDFGFDYQTYQSFRDFENNVRFNTTIHHSILNTKDLTYFVKNFQGMNDNVEIQCEVIGPLSDMKVKKTQILFGENSHFNGNVEMIGLPNIEETFINLDVDNLKVNIQDIINFHFPKGKDLTISNGIKELKWIDIHGHFLGLYNNFFADANIKTGLGNLVCELMFNNKVKPITYDGTVSFNNLNVGVLAETNLFGLVSGKATLKGKGIKVNNMDTRLVSSIYSVDFKGKKVENIELNGELFAKKFTGSIVCIDTNFDIDFNGLIDFNEEEPIYNFEAMVNNINLSELQIYKPDSNVKISGQINADMVGKTLDSLYGKITMQQAQYVQCDSIYDIPDFNLNIEQKENKNKQILFHSDIIEIALDGNFQYKNIVPTCIHLMHKYLPSLIKKPINFDSLNIENQELSFNIDIKQSIPIFELLLPNIVFKDEIKLVGYINKKEEKILLDGNMDYLGIKKMAFNDIQISTSSDRKNLNLELDCKGFRFKNTDTIVDVNNIGIKSNIFNDTISFLASAYGNNINKLEDVMIDGEIGFNGIKNFFIKINNGSILWNNETFLLDSFNRVQISPNNIYVDNFGIRSNKNSSLNIRSGLDFRNKEAILFDFNNIELGIANLFLNRFNVDLQGTATGKGGLVNTDNIQMFAVGSEFKVYNFHFNNVYLGHLDTKTIWMNQEKKLFISSDIYQDSSYNSESKLTNINGYFDPKERYIDLKGDIKNFNIKTLEKYTKSFAHKMEGFGTGEISFRGPINDPKLVGEVVVGIGVIGIDYLKTEYAIRNGKISFIDTGFVFDNFVVSDINNNKIAVNGIVSHHKLKNWGLNLRVRASNAMAFNTTIKDNSLFYGKAFVSGNVSLIGKVGDLIQINAEAITEPKTDFNLMFDWSTTVSENNFITFVSSQPENKQNIDNNSTTTKIGVNLIVKATPEAVVRVHLDPAIGGTIVGRGSGTIELNVDRNNDFNIYGNYIISDGVFNLAYGDILTRSFKLQNGSSILWSGNPIGTINVKAIQSTKVAINNLITNDGDLSTKYRPVAVNNILNLNGNLLKPNFTFTFEMPDADESIKTIVYNSIDTSDREEMVKQMISVLFLGRFEASEANSAFGAINSGLGYSISELVSYQINRFVSSISENLDVRVAYRSDEENAENEYSVDFGSSFLNNRLTIKTSLGLLDQQDIAKNDRFLGDITVEYKIIPDGSLTLKAFNLTNQQDKLEYTSRYSQGLGLSFSKDFDTYKDLFTRKNKKLLPQNQNNNLKTDTISR